jgi:hypothetical protein
MREPLRQRLDGDFPSQPRIACAVDLAHPRGQSPPGSRTHPAACLEQKPFVSPE